MTSDSADGRHPLSTSHIELYSQINRAGIQTDEYTLCFIYTEHSCMCRTKSAQFTQISHKQSQENSEKNRGTRVPKIHIDQLHLQRPPIIFLRSNLMRSAVYIYIYI